MDNHKLYSLSLTQDVDEESENESQKDGQSPKEQFKFLVNVSLTTIMDTCVYQNYLLSV